MFEPEVVVCSVDYDRCFSPERGRSRLRADSLIAYVVNLMTQHPDAKLRLLLGSYRQSLDLDAYYWEYNNNGSAILGLKVLTQEIKKRLPNVDVQIVPLLLADVDNHQMVGSEFHKALSILSNDRIAVRPYSYCDQGDFRWALQSGKVRELNGGHCYKKINKIHWHDRHKRALVYVQMHYVAKVHENNYIHFHFFDDVKESVLDSLQSFYTYAPHFIPDSMQLRLHHYEKGIYQSNLESLLYPIIGKGYVDYDVATNVVESKIDYREERYVSLTAKREINLPEAFQKNHLAIFLQAISAEDWPLAKEHVDKIDKINSVDEICRSLKKLIVCNQFELGLIVLTKTQSLQSSHRAQCLSISHMIADVVENNLVDKSLWLSLLKMYLPELKSNREVYYPLEVLIILIQQQPDGSLTKKTLEMLNLFFNNMVLRHGYMRTDVQRFIDHALCYSISNAEKVLNENADVSGTQAKNIGEKLISDYLDKSVSIDSNNARARYYTLMALKASLTVLGESMNPDEVVRFWRSMPSFQRGVSCHDFIAKGEDSFCCFWRFESADNQFIRKLLKSIKQDSHAATVQMV